MGIEDSRRGDKRRSCIGGCTSITRGEDQVLSVAVAKPYIDDLTGIVLDSQLVQIAIKKELQYFEDKDVWKMEPIANAKKYTGKPPISVRWVHTNKGDDVTPDMRARLVAREIRHNGDEAIFAPSPPFETLRTVLSLAVTQLPGQQPRCRDPKSDERIQISLVDISRAYFNAKIDQRHPTFVELPPEHPQAGLGVCGRLMRHMYGTRHAAQGWQDEYSSTLIELGFTQGLACPCVFYHAERQLYSTVHGDDFTTAGSKRDLDWFESALDKYYELTKGGRLGPGDSDDKQGVILNRIIRWTPDGIEYEADPRQVERLLEETGLEGANPVSTPGVKLLAQQYVDDKDLPDNELTAYRARAARANYLAADRPDIQFTAKEACRWMSRPTKLGMEGLRRMCRYLNGRWRLVYT